MEQIENLEPILRTFWYVAIPSSIVFLLQTILTFVGFDSADGIETDFGGIDTDFHPFTLRNLINFLLGFSWTGISFYSSIENKILLILLSLFVGLLFIFAFFLIVKQVQGLSEDNSFKISNTLNKTAEVYLSIPENKTGKGKIIVSVNGSFHELEAMTENNKIATNATVKIIKIENNNLLIVEQI